MELILKNKNIKKFLNFSFIRINHNIIHKINPISHFEIRNIKKKKRITNNKNLTNDSNKNNNWNLVKSPSSSYYINQKL